MKTIRKGARPITVRGREYSWLRGRRHTEIRNLETNRAVVVPNAEVSTAQEFEPLCECCGENIYNEPPYSVMVTSPATIREHILRKNI